MPDLAAIVGFFRPLLYGLVNKMPVFSPFSASSPSFSPQMLLHGISSMAILPCPFCLHNPLAQCPDRWWHNLTSFSPRSSLIRCEISSGDHCCSVSRRTTRSFSSPSFRSFFLRQCFRRSLIFLLCLRGPVPLPHSIPFQLPADGGHRPSDLSGDFPHAFSRQFIFPYTFSFTYGKMLVVTHGRSPPSGLCRNYHFSRGLLLSHSFCSSVALTL